MTDDVRDRIALRELVDRYAQGVDRRRFDQVAGVFTEDGELHIHRGEDPEPRRTHRGRDAIAATMEQLRRFRVTSHIVANHLVELDPGGERATGETYCLAYHIYDADEGGRRAYIMSIRYADAYVRRDGGWLIAVRRNHVDWTDDRPLSRGPG